ncbi:cell death abnormality protein 1 isoform X2 [Halyomorpha halys]|uniref:cell death abnormality protein 1 isoform X2 n=1 Tax=Halyomorpha halys TaxID=286706 RepID=UPI0006D4F7CC|nr:tenascin-like [Halyomorpha halys]
MGVYLLILLIFVVNVKSSDDCSTSDDCDMIGAVCEQKSCVCPSGYVANSLHTQCLIAAEGYGTACLDNIQCSTSLKSGGICLNNTCVCADGYHYFLGKCWKSAGLGEPCKHDQNCFVSYDFEASICNDKKICECSPGYYQREYSSCRRKSYNPGDSCGIHLDCQFKNAFCTTDRKCSKNQTSVSYKAETITLLAASTQSNSLMSPKVGDNCTSSNECPKNAECNQRKACACKLGFYSQNNNCYPELGASCSVDGDCVGKNTMCRNQTYCTCKVGFVASVSNQYCDKMSRYLGWSCLRDRECDFFGPGSSCVDKKCQCSNNTHYIEDVMYCWETKYIGDKCVDNEDCGGVNTMICSKGICQCIEKTHPSSDKHVCRADSLTVGSKCEENLDCMFENSYCDTTVNSCQCIKGYIYINGSCVSGAGGKCNSTSDCYTEGTNCANGICTCQKGFIGSDNSRKCLTVVQKLSENCLESVQCEEMEGICSEGQCHCRNDSHYVENYKCYKTRYLNEGCTSNGNCTTIKNAVCLKGTCLCQPGYISILNGTTCSGSSHAESTLLVVIVLSLLVICQFN